MNPHASNASDTQPPRDDPAPLVVTVGEFRLELNAGTLTINGERVVLVRKSFQLFEHLVRRRGQIVPPEELYFLLHPEMDEFLPRGLDVYIAHTRGALRSASNGHQFIATVWKQGYTFGEPPGAKSA